MKHLILLCIFFIFVSCSGIKILSQEDSYSDAFLKKIEDVQNVYRDGLRSEALTKLERISDESLQPVEKAKKYNFIGIIKYSTDDIEGALANFERANGFKHNNQLLINQIILNLSSAYYRVEKFDYAKNYLKQITTEAFSKNEKTKYNSLKLSLGRKFEDDKSIVQAAMALGEELDNFEQVETYSYLSVLKVSFEKLTESEKIYLLEGNTSNVLAAYLAKEEALRKISIGNKQSTANIIAWLEDNFSHIPEINKIVKDYESNLKFYSAIDSKAIGVVLPMSGKMKKFGQKALRGIESALSYSKNKNKVSTIYTENSHHNPALAAKAIRRLVEKHKVSVIIGGLFSSTSAAEYLECRKYGVLFISLAAVNLAKTEKNHLLIEIPGSIQSQVYGLTQPEFLNQLGKKIAVIYPNNKKGDIYINELWELHEKGVVEITSVIDYEEKSKDFRSPISHLLGLKYTRERSEEEEIWKAVYSAKKKTSSIRRKQVLKPVIDFDWVFVPSLPHNAIQIIPTFNWFDARYLKYVGIPSSNSKKLVRSQFRSSSLFFVGDSFSNDKFEFYNEYKERNKTSPKLVETLSFEAMNMALDLSHALSFTSREDFSEKVYGKSEIKGFTGVWKIIGNQWIKDLQYLKIKRKKVLPLVEGIN